MVTDAFPNLLCCRCHCLQEWCAPYIWLLARAERGFFAVYACAVGVPFNPEKLEIGIRMKKVLAETHTGSQLHISERNRDAVQCFFILRNRSLEIMVLMFTDLCKSIE